MKQLLLLLILAMFVTPIIGCTTPPEAQVRGPGLIFFYTDG